jgi:hypothetical protein
LGAYAIASAIPENFFVGMGAASVGAIACDAAMAFGKG